ncbi:MAG: hypothetical protein OHK0015_33630 [Chloroflexi bacterium OHK40]
MLNAISACGHVTAVLVLNMRRFVEPAYHKRFERLRGSEAFLHALRTSWPARIESRGAFSVAQHQFEHKSVDTRMSTDEVAFLSGVFRLNALEDYSVPLYYLHDKERVEFPVEVRDNLQFTNVFMEVWSNWEVYVRPTVTGLFVISLRRRYTRTTPLLKIAADVVSLQTAFDIPGANQRLEELASLGNGAGQKKQESIRAFLNWLDAGEPSGGPRYAPVQWKLAMEVCRQLVADAGLTIDAGELSVPLQSPDRTISTPLHDSFLIYHIEELLALEPIVLKARGLDPASEPDEQAEPSVGRNGARPLAVARKGVPKIHVTPNDILRSEELRQQVAGLLEGAVLRKLPNGAATLRLQGRPAKATGQLKSYFPEHREPYLDGIFACNVATWEDEMCIVTGRAAFVMPSRHASRDELQLSNFSASTGRVMYLWYWEALERMFELVIEVRVLAHLIERGSSDLLRGFEQELTRLRKGMSQRDIRVNYAVLAEKVERVANMSRLLGLGQSLSTPSVWGRAEFAVAKARLLLEHQDVPLLMQHAERNVANLNELINHIDELYLADLSENNNRLSFYLSILLAGLSLSVIVFTVISFWADAEDLKGGSVPPAIIELIPPIVTSGSILSLVLSLVALTIIAWGVASFSRSLLRRAERRARRGGGR